MSEGEMGNFSTLTDCQGLGGCLTQCGYSYLPELTGFDPFNSLQNSHLPIKKSAVSVCALAFFLLFCKQKMRWCSSGNRIKTKPQAVVVFPVLDCHKAKKDACPKSDWLKWFDHLHDMKHPCSSVCSSGSLSLLFIEAADLHSLTSLQMSPHWREMWDKSSPVLFQAFFLIIILVLF